MKKFFEHSKINVPSAPWAPPDSAQPGSTVTMQAPCVDSPSETLTLQVSADHIYWAARTGLQKPMQLCLQRATGTLWQLYSNGLALEVMSPYRACQLPEVVYLNCTQWEELLSENQVEYEVKLIPTEEHEGYSLLQRRSMMVSSTALSDDYLPSS